MSDDFFGDLGKNISRYTQKAMERTGNLVETAKINSQISSEEKEIAKLYSKIGEAVYRKCVEGSLVPDASLEETIDEIRQHKEQAREYKKNLARVRGMKICPSCQELIPKDVAFCPHCGAATPLDDETVEEEDNDANTVDGTATTVEEDPRETADEAGTKGESCQEENEKQEAAGTAEDTSDS